MFSSIIISGIEKIIIFSKLASENYFEKFFNND